MASGLDKLLDEGHGIITPRGKEIFNDLHKERDHLRKALAAILALDSLDAEDNPVRYRRAFWTAMRLANDALKYPET